MTFIEVGIRHRMARVVLYDLDLNLQGKNFKC